MNVGDSFITYLVFQYADEGMKRYQRDMERAGKIVNEHDRKVGGLIHGIRGISGALFGIHSGLAVVHKIADGFKYATKQAIGFEYALMDIKKVKPDIDLEQVREDLFEISKYAPGKDVIKDLAPAYKLAVQELHDQEAVKPFMKMVERLSIAYDLTAEKTAEQLGKVYQNLKEDNRDLSITELLQKVERIAGEMAYLHHTHGNASVEQIMYALERGIGTVRATGMSPEFALSLITQMINTGTQAETAGMMFKRLNARIQKGADYDENGKKHRINVPQMQRAFRDIGLSMTTMRKLLSANPDRAYTYFFKKLYDYNQKYGRAELMRVLTPIAGQYIISDLAKVILDLPSIMEYYKDIKNKDYTYYSNEAYKTIMQTTTKRLQDVSTTWQRVAIEFGESWRLFIAEMAPILTKLGNRLAEGLSESNKKERALLEYGNNPADNAKFYEENYIAYKAMKEGKIKQNPKFMHRMGAIEKYQELRSRLVLYPSLVASMDAGDLAAVYTAQNQEFDRFLSPEHKRKMLENEEKYLQKYEPEWYNWKQSHSLTNNDSHNNVVINNTFNGYDPKSILDKIKEEIQINNQTIITDIKNA